MGGSSSAPVRAIKPSDGVDDEEAACRRQLEPGRGDPDSIAISGCSEPSKVGLRCDPTTGSWELEDEEGGRKNLSDEVVNWFKSRNSETLKGSLAFVPWIVQQSYFEGGLDEGKIIMHRGSGAVVFSDASGFTALTERLAVKSNGAELLSQCLTAFFTPLINLINAYRGDVIKFSGDALTIYFPAVDDTAASRTRVQVPPHGSFGLPDLGPMATAVLRAAACCIEIHKRLHMFDTGVDGVRLCLHIGVGCGEVTMLQVGGAIPPETHVPRFEYIIAGNPIEQISIAEPLAKNGETCLSPQAWEHVSDCVIEDTGRSLERPDFHLLLKMDEQKYTFPTIKYSAMERDCRAEKQFKLSELNVIRRYIPSAVFKQIEGGTLTYVNEMRNISTIFISGSGIDVSSDEGALVAHELMSSIQRVCYSHEGTLNKFVIDDKGMLFLLVFGLPPLVHTDDPTRAVLSCFEMVKTFERFKLIGRFGVTTGRSYCGVCGSAQRMEYTVLGDPVNLSARLMANAPQGGILIDEATTRLCTRELLCEELPAIRVKGKTNPITIFRPRQKGPPEYIGLEPTGSGRVSFPWYDRPLSISQQISMTEESLAVALKENVAQLCSVSGWDGLLKVQKLLGGEFSVDLHRKPAAVPKSSMSSSLSSPPDGSPFANGGVVVIEGNDGMGKIELAEHMVLYAGHEFSMLPVFGTMGPRIADLDRFGIELLLSTIGVFRHLDPHMPRSDLDALQRILPEHLAGIMPQVREAFEGKADEERRRALLKPLVELVASLLEILRKKTSVLVVLQLVFGTSLFGKTLESFAPFWTMAAILARVAESGCGHGDKPVVVTFLVKQADHNHPSVRKAIQNDWLVKLNELSDDNCVEYMAAYLRGSPDMVPPELNKFIAKLSLGNPLYIRETIDQLLSNEYIKIVREADGKPITIKCHHDLDGINIASWGQTAMVGNTVCLLESLDPLEAAVLKMSTCFEGAFTLPDLAASTRSRWAGATQFDYLRIFRAIQNLVKRGILEVPLVVSKEKEQLVSPSSSYGGGMMGSPSSYSVAASASAGGGSTGLEQAKLQTFEMKNMLIRKVGGSMVLEAQKKVVKRQALIDRTLSRDLPARMEEVRTKRLEPHIPWYYENVLAKGA
mmetsp:Transcript_44947/g.144002  ORF Transcript_44947/g.144002 Transcript_44947/m.144002 type:complete len:1129 (-) Transcript_44947:87-3473(-)|eukprot:CAMPEP_0203908554 /NCGR_PEP_ID=MMETSP0359-20131031/49924_1 /ASSEMBLY_ACC=CAM_ASM_000338 /TAXON_ID=268821 /ORGANISM="Scrippsiella Hangoei, Strain SHTV-5" /LENGTH=1128 /DNA_ID=CAMNT_0050833583 /DNA_START=129 /DNA_END=3515 /DNA_ORIENTATION=+